MGVCRPVRQILTLFQTDKCHFPDPFSNTNYLLDLVKRSVKFSFNSFAISEFISIITKTSKCSLVVISQLVNTRNMLWSLAPIKNEIFRPTKSFISLKKARKKGHLDLWHPLRPSSPPKP